LPYGCGVGVGDGAGAGAEEVEDVGDVEDVGGSG
jgi:hypothetical protein